MSDAEVISAVSAVVSTFHESSELLKHIKAKRRKSHRALQEFEEKQLQDSLISGEQQIGFKYAQDMRDFGDAMRVGDVIARDRLQHIALMMQGEVIKSLKMAAQFEHAVLSLTLLHEASITNKRDAIVTLDELKQRLLMRIPAPWQFEEAPYTCPDPASVATPQAGKLGAIDPMTVLSDDYVPAAVTILSQEEAKEQKHGLASYFRKRRSHSLSKVFGTNATPDINFSPALEQLARAKGETDRAKIMKEIDHIIDSYNGLHVNQASSPRISQQLGGSLQRQDTLTMLNGFGPSTSEHPIPTPTHLFSNSPQRPDGLNSNKNSHHRVASSPQFNQSQQSQNHDQPQYMQNPHSETQIQQHRSRLSAASASSSIPSETPIQRNGSFSSQESQAHPFPLPLIRSSPNLSPITPQSPFSLSIPHPCDDGNLSPHSSYAASERTHSQASQPLSPQRSRGNSNVSSPPRVDSNSYPNSPCATSPTHDQPRYIPHFPDPPKQPTSPQDQKLPETRHKYHLMPSSSREAPSMRDTNPERSIRNSLSPPTSPTRDSLRLSSTAPSIISTDSAISANIGVLPGSLSKIISSGSIQGSGSEKIMDARPCKANNYWGFCKGAWTIQQDVKKGLQFRTQPAGLYNTKEIWSCAECTFQGPSFATPHPTKKGKSISIIDPRIATSSSSGIRYRWIFLAKSHTRRKLHDATNPIMPVSSAIFPSPDDYSYGCVFCAAEDKVTSVYGGVETLMKHISTTHVASMSEKTRRKAHCVIGRVAGVEEEWDVNVPVFADPLVEVGR